MELKKNPLANVEHKKPVLYWVGLLFACSVVLVAFEWRTTTYEEFVAGNLDIDFIEEEIIPVSRMKAPPPPPPPPVIHETFELVEELTETIEPVEWYEPEPLEPEEIHELEPVTEIIDEEKVWTVVEEYPEFPGGKEMFYQFLQDNIKYPAEAKRAGVSGKVYLRFVIGKDGQIIEAEVLDGPGYGLNEEALRVFGLMPAWSPGIQNGHPVKVEFTFPINFR
jgi:protein TonB